MPKNKTKTKRFASTLRNSNRTSIGPLLNAKIIYNTPVSRPVTMREFRPLYDEVMSIPIYIIVCHGAVCASFEDCGITDRDDKIRNPTFMIPKSTYILNATSGGEYCWYASSYTDMFKELKDELRYFLLIDDRDDIQRSKGSTNYDMSVFSTFNRATQMEYPNLYCYFGDSTREGQGVYDLSTTKPFTIENSIIDVTKGPPHNPERKYKWMLDEVIAETYRVTNTNRGIFLFTGCTSGMDEELPLSKLKEDSRSGLAVASAQSLIYLAETSYSTLTHALDSTRLLKKGALAITPMHKTGISQLSRTENYYRSRHERDSLNALKKRLVNTRKAYNNALLAINATKKLRRNHYSRAMKGNEMALENWQHASHNVMRAINAKKKAIKEFKALKEIIDDPEANTLRLMDSARLTRDAWARTPYKGNPDTAQC